MKISEKTLKNEVWIFSSKAVSQKKSNVYFAKFCKNGQLVF